MLSLFEPIMLLALIFNSVPHERYPQIPTIMHCQTEKSIQHLEETQSNLSLLTLAVFPVYVREHDEPLKISVKNFIGSELKETGNATYPYAAEFTQHIFSGKISLHFASQEEFTQLKNTLNECLNKRRLEEEAKIAQRKLEEEEQLKRLEEAKRKAAMREKVVYGTILTASIACIAYGVTGMLAQFNAAS